MAELGKLLVGVGVLLIVVGGVLVLSGTVGDKGWFIGRLPGDFHIQRGNWSLYFPLTTSILVSVVLTLILTLVFRR